MQELKIQILIGQRCTLYQSILVLTAQDCVLQLLLSIPDPEQVPSLRSILVLVRDRVLFLPPQDSEQADQGVQLPQTQFSGKNNNNSKLENHNLK